MYAKSIFALILGVALSFSCNHHRDGLPSASVQLMLDRSVRWAELNLDSSMHYARLALALSQSLGDKAGEEKAWALPTAIYVNRMEAGETTDSLAYALLRWSEASGSQYGTARAKSALGILAFRKGDFKAAIPLLTAASEIEKPGPTLINDLINLGAAYGAMGAWAEELKCYSRASEMLVVSSDAAIYPRILANAASCLADLGYQAVAKQSYLYCIDHYAAQNPSALADAYTGLSIYYRDIGEYDSAYYCLKASDSIWRSAGDIWGFLRNRIEAAKIEYESNRYQVVLDSLKGIEALITAIPDSLIFYEMIRLKGLSLIALGSVDSSLMYLGRYESFATRSGNRHLISEYYQLVCDVFRRFGFFNNSDRYCLTAARFKGTTEIMSVSVQDSSIDLEESLIRKQSSTTAFDQYTRVGIGIVLVAATFGVVFLLIRYRRRRKAGQPTASIVVPPTSPTPGVTAAAHRKTPLAIHQPPISFEDVICAKSQGHFFLLVYLDEQGKAQAREVDTRTPKKLPLSVFQENSQGRLLESKRGYLVNPAFIRLSEDKSKIYLLAPDAVALVEANIERKRKTGDGFFDEYPLPIATTPGKNFIERLAAWQVEFGEK